MSTEIRPIRNKKTGQQFYPQTNVKAVVGLDSAIEPFDISVYNATEGTPVQYSDLSAALAGTNVPYTVRHGGMSIRFINSTTGKYERWQLMSTSWSFAVANWQGVDAVPTSDSKNLVESGGIKSSIDDIGLAPEIFTDVTLPSVIQGSYLNYFGELKSFPTLGVYMIPVTEHTFIKIVNDYHVSVASRSYVFYNSETPSVDAVVSVGPMILSSADTEVALVPTGATYVGCTVNTSTTNPSNFSFQVANAEPSGLAFSNLYDSMEELNADIESDIESIQEQLDTKANLTDLIIEKWNNIEPGDAVTYRTIAEDGSLDIEQSRAFRVYPFQVTAGDIVKVHNSFNIGHARSYAFYSSNDYSAETALLVGPRVDQAPEEIILTVPDGAVCVLLQAFTTGEQWVAKKAVESVKEAIDVLQSEMEDINDAIPTIEEFTNSEYLYKDTLAYQFNGDDLFVAWNNGNGKEFTYWFKKCMANNLFTFYNVGYRNVNRIKPDVSGIGSALGITIINSAQSSDNIGPINLRTVGWVGGNHLYPNNTDIPNYKTAKTDSFKVFADGKELQGTVSGFAKNVSVFVENSIYEPPVPVEPTEEYLISKLCTEYATYVVRKSTIEVGVSHKFVDNTVSTVSVYYGMQSMFLSETQLITPSGQFTDWTAIANVGSFTKENYPYFNRFIEKSTTTNAYQSTFLNPHLDLGNHSQIGNSDDIFRTGPGKAYHVLISNKAVAGKMFQWRGCYTFFTEPFIDNEDVLVYTGVVDGKDTLFINTKGAFVGFLEVPSELALKKVEVVECHGLTTKAGDTNFVLGSGLYIESSGAGSLILSAV